MTVHDTEYGYGSGLLTVMLGLSAALFYETWHAEPFIATVVVSAYVALSALLFEHGTRNAYQNWRLAERAGRWSDD
ncbi:hypothetical protein C441_04724 [Haloferax sulfurifontis ATCC BAA-897]|uniref:Uncharacterized protein n=1 Tax=Haloferax sulfurifontis ATCC BAA-897 TaxID=662480 RepID=M0ILA9_9EURY|nr:hypothetical protein C441_04724 [Haloferax sulfurifontis ATCC BAA-897]